MAKVEWTQVGSIKVNGSEGGVVFRRVVGTKYKNYKYAYLDDNANTIRGYASSLGEAINKMLNAFIDIMPEDTAYVFGKEPQETI